MRLGRAHPRYRAPRLTILRGVPLTPHDTDGPSVGFEEFKRMARPCALLHQAFRYDTVTLRTPRVDATPKPFAVMAALRLLARHRAEIVDELGGIRRVTIAELVRAMVQLLADGLQSRALLRSMTLRTERLSGATTRSEPASLDLDRPALYVSPGYSFGLRSGGQVSHTVGVLNSLGRHAASTLWVTSDPYPTASDAVEIHEVDPDGRFADFHELAWLAFNDRVLETARTALGSTKPAFIYQRAAVGALAAAELAVDLGVPYVLEHNSSAVTYSRLWGKPLDHEGLAADIERATIRAADLVVVVSEPLRDEVIDLGAEPERVLVNPNGVDPDVYSPEVDGSTVRGRYGLDGKFVFGFLGSFGPYHGTTVLAQAFVALLRDQRVDPERVHLLMVGDGPARAETEAVVEAAEASGRVTFTGWTEQSEGPAHMAACDVLVSPHVPNRDGTRFFGSPTKLFEYMAMGKPIVASRLEQLAEILEHDETAVLLPPGDPQALAEAMISLMENAATRERLATNARVEVISRHTWASHTAKIIDRLSALRGLARGSV